MNALVPRFAWRDTSDQLLHSGSLVFGPDATPAAVNFSGTAGRRGFFQDRWFDNTFLGRLLDDMVLEQTALAPIPTNDSGSTLYDTRKLVCRGYMSGRVTNISSGRVRVVIYQVKTKRYHSYSAIYPPDQLISSLGSGGSPLVLASKLLYANAGGGVGAPGSSENILQVDRSWYGHAQFPLYFRVRKIRSFFLEHGQAMSFRHSMGTVSTSRLDLAETTAGIGGSIGTQNCKYLIYQVDGQAGVVGNLDDTAGIVPSAISIVQTKYYQAKYYPYQAAQSRTGAFGRQHVTSGSGQIMNEYGTAGTVPVEIVA